MFAWLHPPGSRLARPLLAGLFTLCAAVGAAAESSCSSDGQPARTVLVERFVNADCASCWTDLHQPLGDPPAVGVEWIVPGRQGDDAPLSVAARRDGLDRLRALRRVTPDTAVTLPAQAVGAKPVAVRVAHGLAFQGYIAVSIEMRPRATPAPAPWKAWLLLVEVIPAGTEHSKVERQLVRNSLQLEWDARRETAPDAGDRFFESRPMQIPEGADPRRLAVVGWVEDAQGRLHGLAQSRCPSQEHKLV